MARERERSIAFLRALARSLAQRVEELPFGFAVFDDSVPNVWDLNFLWLDAVPDGLSPDGFAALADRLQGEAGLEHRQGVVVDDERGELLGARLVPLGWTATRHLLMAHRREPDRTAESAAAQVEGARMRTFAEASLREDGAGLSEDTIRQLIAARDVVARGGARFFAAELDGQLAAACDLYTDGTVAQVEAVVTRRAYRNRGLARAVVLAAIDAARADGCELVFLQTDEDDSPKDLYVKLGFDAIGRLWVLQKKPDEA